MARISSKTLQLEASPSPDVAGYRMYYVPLGDNLDYNAPYIELDNSLMYDLTAFNELSLLDALFDVAFTSIDDAGNESDMGAVQTAVPFDFVAPAPPVSATFSIGLLPT